ncbi:MAG: hypothetical protein WBX25_11205 [Rhodomicrobium sp.]
MPGGALLERFRRFRKRLVLPKPIFGASDAAELAAGFHDIFELLNL